MAEVLNHRTAERLRRQLVLLVGPVLLLAGGCASSAPPSAPTAPLQESAVAAPAAPAAPEAPTVEIASIELREGAPDASLVVDADGPLVWTGYRDDQGRLVVELPNSAPGAAVPATLPGAGFVTGVTVERDQHGERPLTRLVVSTSEPIEHSMVGEGNRLKVVLTPVQTSAPAVSYEPLPEATAVEANEAPAVEAPAAPAASPHGAPADVGTVDHPAVAPPPTGVVASRLEGVEVLPDTRGTAVHVAGDGEFSYSTFALDDPYRFVIDLTGVVNDARRSTVVVDSAEVERVRMAQFKPAPSPVSRVVFDLREPAVPQIERGADGLIVRFGPPVTAGERSAAVGGAGAESGSRPDAQGGSEAEPAQAAPAPKPEAMQSAPPPPVAAAAPPPAEEPEPPAAAVVPPVAAAAPTPAPQSTAPAPAAAPPAATPAAKALPSTSDLELYKKAEVKIEGPAAASATQNFSAQRVTAGEHEFVGEPITMSLRDADLVETLRSFAQISGLNIVIQPGVRGSVTVQLEDVPWDQAFEEILKINGLGYELEGNIMRIAPTATLRTEAQERQQLEAARALSVPLQTVIKRLSYSSARSVATLLQGRGGVLSQRGTVIVDPRTNTLIIKELPTNMDTVIAVIENLDIPEPQVMIEARIVETRKNFTRTLGIDWSFAGAADAAHGNTTGLVFPATATSSGGVNLITGGSTAFLNLSLGTLSGAFHLDAALVAAENEGLINILSAPKVATLNNERASIQSGFQIPIQTVANNTVSVQYVNATLRLDVTPQVTAEGTILMDINIQKRNPEFALQVVGSNAAPISTKEAQTRVIVRDGGTTVIGGIYEVSTNTGEDRVPGLANVPIIGHLFKNRRREDSNSELLIFITPRVIRI
jgi:type IV pilus assembly protein PilQ